MLRVNNSLGFWANDTNREVVTSSFRGALVNLAADQTAINAFTSTYLVPWDEAEYDLGGWWDAGEPTRLTVPTGVSAVRVYGGALVNNISTLAARVTLHKGGNPYFLNHYSSQTNTDRSWGFVSPVFDVSAGDYFEFGLASDSDTSIDLATGNTYFCIEAVAVPQRALAAHAGASATDFTALAALSYTDPDVYDTDAIHDTSTNPSRLTVPSGVTMVRLTALRTHANFTGNTYSQFLMAKDGTFDLPGLASYSFETGDDDGGNALASAPIEVSSGQYFEMLYQSESDTSSDLLAGSTYFGMEVINAAAFSGALVTKASDETTADYTGGAVVSWDTETYDIGGWHESVTNPSRLTVPAGVSRVRLYGQINTSSIATANMVLVAFLKNGGTTWEGRISQRTEFSATVVLRDNAASPVLEVTPGDYFELRYLVETDTSVTIESHSWFAIEKVS